MAMEILAWTGEESHQIIRENISFAESQLLQDIVCLMVHGGKRDGFFVEVGVGDGKRISNTYLQETRFNWCGILVEPCRGFHDSIRTKRRAVLDLRAAVRVGGPPQEFCELVGAEEFSGLGDLSAVNGTRESEGLKSYFVETASLEEILLEQDAPRNIDYVSVDTEGTEIEVLSGIDWDRREIGFLSVEHNHRRVSLRELRRLLEPRGYIQILPEISAYDAWFVHRSIEFSTIL